MTPDEEKYLKSLGFEPVNNGKTQETMENNINSIIVSQKNIDADRFKFRAIFNITYTGDNEEEIEAKIIINEVGVLNRNVYFHRDDLITSLEKLNLTDKQEEEIIGYFEANNGCADDDFFWIDADYIDQCTGLKDKNSKLIYGGDIVDVFYNDYKAGRYLYKWESPAFYVEPFENNKPSGSHWYYFAVAHERCVIIGNIHENPELLGGTK